MNNSAAIGYMIMAAKKAALYDHEISIMEETMLKLMDEKTEEEAEQAYKSF